VKIYLLSKFQPSQSEIEGFSELNATPSIIFVFQILTKHIINEMELFNELKGNAFNYFCFPNRRCWDLTT
jgi:hypothetical protein